MSTRRRCLTRKCQFIGRRVAKVFGGGESCDALFGTVIRLDRVPGIDLYLIEYDCGDSEHIQRVELKEMINLHSSISQGSEERIDHPDRYSVTISHLPSTQRRDKVDCSEEGEEQKHTPLQEKCETITYITRAKNTALKNLSKIGKLTHGIEEIFFNDLSHQKTRNLSRLAQSITLPDGSKSRYFYEEMNGPKTPEKRRVVNQCLSIVCQEWKREEFSDLNAFQQKMTALSKIFLSRGILFDIMKDFTGKKDVWSLLGDAYICDDDTTDRQAAERALPFDGVDEDTVDTSPQEDLHKNKYNTRSARSNSPLYDCVEFSTYFTRGRKKKIISEAMRTSFQLSNNSANSELTTFTPVYDNVVSVSGSVCDLSTTSSLTSSLSDPFSSKDSLPCHSAGDNSRGNDVSGDTEYLRKPRKHETKRKREDIFLNATDSDTSTLTAPSKKHIIVSRNRVRRIYAPFVTKDNVTPSSLSFSSMTSSCSKVTPSSSKVSPKEQLTIDNDEQKESNSKKSGNLLTRGNKRKQNIFKFTVDSSFIKKGCYIVKPMKPNRETHTVERCVLRSHKNVKTSLQKVPPLRAVSYISADNVRTIRTRKGVAKNSHLSSSHMSSQNKEESGSKIVSLVESRKKDTRKNVKRRINLSNGMDREMAKACESSRKSYWMGILKQQQDTLLNNRSLRKMQRLSSTFTFEEFIGLWNQAESYMGATVEEIENGSLVREANNKDKIAGSFSSNQSRAQFGRTLFSGMKEFIAMTNLSRNDIFLDIGHGLGNAVLQAAFTIGCESRGIEVVPVRCRVAEQFQEILMGFLDVQESMHVPIPLRNRKAGKVTLREGSLTDKRHEVFITEADVVLVNNAHDIFGTRSGDISGKPMLDYKVACLFAMMKPGSRMVCFTPILYLGRGIFEENEMREKNGLEGCLDSSFYTCEKRSLGRNVVHWSSHEVIVYLYTRVQQSSTDGSSLFLCSDKKCEGNMLPTAAITSKGVLEEVCKYCKAKRPVATRSKFM